MALWSNLQRLLVCLFFFVLYTFTMKFLKLESQSQEPLMILPTIIGRSQDNSEYSSSHNDGFITITEIPFESGSAAAVPLLQWIGGDHVHRLIMIFGRVNESSVNLFRSQENGSMVNETCKLLPGAVIDSFFISKNSNKLIFSDLVNHHLYVTTDSGETYSIGNLTLFTPSVIQFSDNNETYLFAIDSPSHSLYVSTQLGLNDSWMNLSTKVEAAYWTQLKDGQNFDDPTAIYFTESEQSGCYRIKKAVSPYHNSCTCKFCQDIGEVTNFKLVYEYIFVIKNTKLFVSYQRQPFIQARFIPAMGGNQQYSVVDASQGQVLLAVFKNDTTADLYISDEWGTNYSLSLQNIIVNNFQWNSGIESIDFYMVKGAQGTYIANVANVGSRSLPNNTVISFNKGAKWSLVNSPTLDSDMNSIECYYPDCSLHLDIRDSGIVSKESAVGVIVARGTFVEGSNQSLYLSYDGGFSWIELFKAKEKSATYLFDILDSGSIILVVNKSENAKEFMISCDTGFTWQYYNISSCGINISGLHTEMSDTASLSMLYGYMESPYPRYVIVNLNMSHLNISECKDDCDYITWMPSDGRIGDRCVLGKKVKYCKRKPGKCCRNKAKYWMLADTAHCNCTIEDFGCEVGFEHIDYNSLCTPVDSYNFAPTIYNYGYRRISGDECVATRNSYFYNELQPCSNRIFALYVNATPSPAAVAQEITFTVSVNGMHHFKATYHFLYGDSCEVHTTSNIVKHNYNISGYFPVKVIVSTAAGNSSTVIGIFVEDFQLKATPPIVAVNQSVTLSVTKGLCFENYTYLFSFGDGQSSLSNSSSSEVYSYYVSGSYQASVMVYCAGISISSETVVLVQDNISTICVNTFMKSLIVTYIAIIDCEAPSDHIYGTIQYTWDFDKNWNVTTYLTTVTAKYESMGTYNFSVFASNNVSQKSYTGQINIYTEYDTTNVQISIIGSKFVPMNITVNFSVSSNIPAVHNLTHNWTIIDRETSQIYATNKSNKLVIKFAKPGEYKLLVLINYNGSVLSSSYIISVETNISYIKVEFSPVTEVARQTAIFINLYDIHNDSYEEFVNISITSDTQTSILKYIKSPITVKTYLSYSVNDIYKVDVIANNHVSNVSTNFTIEVVRTNTTLLLEFSVAALSQANVSYETTSWRKQFSDVIDTSLTNDNSFPDWQLIVTAGSVGNFLEMFVDVLPMSSSLTALANATMIAEHLIHVIDSNYTFSWPNSSLSISVSNVKILGLQQETNDGLTKAKNVNNSLGLGIEIGLPVLIVIIISILIGIIFYKRKLHQRQQYGQLRLALNVERETGLDRSDEIVLWTRTSGINS